MKRSKRLLPVKQLKKQEEQKEAKKLADAQNELRQAEQQLDELHQYRQDYYQSLHQPSGSLTASNLAKYQVFLTRLNRAIENQSQMLNLKKKAVDAQTKVWAAAHARHKAMEELIERFSNEEQIEKDKQEQKLMDEFALRNIKRES